MSTNVLVPKEKLKELENARLALYDFIGKHMSTGNKLHDNANLVVLHSITGIMWQLSNRKWPEERLLVSKEEYESPDCL